MPRPAVIIQANAFNDEHPSVVVLPLTTTIESAPLIRITIDPTAANGLRHVSQVMIDKPATIRRERIGGAIGRLDDAVMARITGALALFVGIG